MCLTGCAKRSETRPPAPFGRAGPRDHQELTKRGQNDSMLPPCWYRMPGGVGEAGTGMTFHQPLVRTGAGLVTAAALALLCACSSDRELPTGEPSFYRSMATSGAQ